MVRITPQVVYVDAEMGEFDVGKVEYRVESPDTAVEVESKMDDVQLKAAAAVKKRNVEGLLTGKDKLALERGAKMLKRNALNPLGICAAPKEDC
ncbi:uncharacterized protein LOC123452245 isoform X2 [Hordeum vulgare subsp. vulgare]|uniref:uncharacterized protein LOC123452245 isoform X2 n=1 Tax=Hordeum vulgare subsp. vulgare TaxID=112509 RepID=UPI001D1A5A39|nr:uncharacterized protein LOC123452245 isoform X2 [Hordeum vulgare subsp. vulgare]